MYLNHFGLREFPFGITPDTSFIYSADAHQEALNTLLIGLNTGEGFIKITGEVGTGKTLLCRRFLATLGEDQLVAYLPNPMLEPRILLIAIAEELGLKLQGFDYQFHLLKEFNQHLLNMAAQGKRVVICIDEAQSMPLESLEALRLLSNLETEKRKLLQVVMFGQPELDEKLADPAVRHLRQCTDSHPEGSDFALLDRNLECQSSCSPTPKVCRRPYGGLYQVSGRPQQKTTRSYFR